MLEDKLPKPSGCLFWFSLGSDVMDQRGGDGRFNGGIEVIAIRCGQEIPEFWNAGREKTSFLDHQSPHCGAHQSWSMKQEWARLRATARREEIDWVRSESVYEIVPMQNTDESVDSTSKVLVSILMSVSLSNEGKSLKLEHYDISRAYLQGTAQRLIYIRLPAEDRQKYGEDKVGRLVKGMYGTQDASHTWQLDCANRICGESGSFRRDKHSAALFHDKSIGIKSKDAVSRSNYRYKEIEEGESSNSLTTWAKCKVLNLLVRNTETKFGRLSHRYVPVSTRRMRCESCQPRWKRKLFAKDNLRPERTRCSTPKYLGSWRFRRFGAILGKPRSKLQMWNFDTITSESRNW